MNSFKPTDSDAQPISDPSLVKLLVDKLTSPPEDIGIIRKLCDPIKHGEPRFALFSFIKAQGVEPDKDGFFGVAKIRGAFASEKEAAERAEELIRDVDSVNSIHTCLIGVPFPLVVSGSAAEVTKIDLKNKVEQTISANVKAKRKEEEQEIAEINKRRNELMKNEGKIEPDDPETRYIEQRVKLAHLRHAIAEYKKKGADCIELEKTVRSNLKEWKEKNPEFEENYIAKYKQARRDAFIPETTDFTGFMQYFADPIDPQSEPEI